ncbi:MAG TPA: DUF6541 family protein, partial [Pseudonocardiaceae bacterium]
MWLSAAPLCLVYVIVLCVPGAMIALAAGQRGWVMAYAAAPVTYGVIGLAGPLLPLLGLRWSALTFLVAALVLAGLIYGVRRLFKRAGVEPETPRWDRSRHLALAAAIALATVVGIVATYRASNGFTAIPQWWDAGFHAEAIRFIADTGNSAPSAMKAIVAPAATSYFYPTGYHVLDATVFSLGHWSVPQVLNASNACQVGVFALSLAGLVKEVTGRPALACATGILACAFTDFPYDVQSWGPLFPFAAAVAVLPALLALVVRAMTAPTVGRIAVAAFAIVGATAVHPSVTIAGAILACCYLVQRWFLARRVPMADLRTIGVLVLVTCVLGVFQLIGSLTASSALVAGWPPFEPGGDALGQLITGSRSMTLPQWWLLVLGAIGLMAIRRVAALGWALVGAGLFVVLFVLSAYDTSPIVAELTKAWWGDSWRLAAFATAGLVVLAAVGLTVVADALGGVFRFRPGRPVAFGVVLVALLVLTRGLYVARNTARLAQLFPDGPVVSHQDVAAMAKLATLAPAGSLVLNDPYDGSPWMFALDDVRP